MKQKGLLKTMLLLCALIAGSASVWADTDTANFTTSDFSGQGTSGSGSAISATVNSVTFACDKGFGTTEIRCYSGSTITISSSNTITAISFTFDDKNGGLETSYTGLSTTEWSKKLSSQARITAVTVTFESSDSRTSVNVETLTFSPTSLAVGSGETATATATHDTPACTTATFTYESLNTDIATCTAAGVISPVAKGTAVIKVTMSIPGSDENYKVGATATKTAEFTVTNPIHTASFYVNGTKVNDVEVEEGEDITFPSDPAAIGGKDFIGWATSTITGTTDSKPSLVTAATMDDTDVDFYAVFANVTGSIPVSWTETALSAITTTDVFVFATEGGVAIPNDNGTSGAPGQVSITVAGGKITSAVADRLKWNVSGNSTDGYTFYPNGSTTTWLYCNTTATSKSNDNIRVGTGARKVWEFDSNSYLKTKDAYTVRYLSIYSTQDFRGYTNTDNAFVPKFYKYIAASFEANGYCTTVSTPIVISDATWASFSNASEVAIPAGVTAYYASASAGGKVTLKEITGGYIPANTGVVLHGDADTYNATVTATGATLGETNLLKPWLTAGTPGDATYYTLAVDGSNNPIFKLSAGGTLAAGKAYLVLGGGARELTVDFDEMTGIGATLNDNVEMINDNVIYDLSGRRVENPTKGIYIMNGKKVVIR